MAQYIPTDPLFQYQWNLLNTGQSGGTPGIDLNVTYVWPDYTGAGVTLAVYDNGVDYNHVDLKDNYDAALSAIINGSPSDAHYLSTAEASSGGFNSLNGHGTGISGIAAAENNGIGSVGVAYDASLVGVYFPIFSGNTPRPELIQAAQNLTNYDVAVFASGSLTYTGGAASAAWTDFYTALQSAVSTGRDGLGTILLNSTHNNGPVAGNYDTNASQWDAHRTFIHVGGVGDTGFAVPNATRSAAMLVSGFTGYQATAEPDGSPHNIIGTDITGADGFVPGDYAQAGGTTSAVAQVAGVAALVLQANPDLGWRDVQEIFSLSARHTGSAVGGPPNTIATETDAWEFNGATDWNGGGRHYSIDYGYGYVDALAAVRLAETWLIDGSPADVSSNEASSINPISPPTTAIPDNNGNSVTLSFTVTDNIQIESVQLRLGFNHANPEDLKIVLTSPDGTQSTILHPMDNGTAPSITNWRFNSQEFRGELSAGTWTVTITDTVSGNTGSVTGNSALAFFGSSDTTDNRYVYTNEYADYSSLGGRDTLTDTDGGNDTINAAAVTSNSTINLNAGTTSTIAGRSLTIAVGSLIENAIGGDGNDTLTGNSLDNILVGGRGTNTLDGGAGDDTAAFLQSHDKYTIQRVGSTIVVTGTESTDTLSNIEHLKFSDITLDSTNLFFPQITSDGGGATASASVPENTTAVTTVTATDQDPGTTISYSIVGGADQSKFQIDGSTGVLSFTTAPDYENPSDADHNNSYLVTVRASDGTLTTDQALTINVTDVSETPPGVVWAGSPDLGARSPAYAVAGVGDFDGDGTSDVLWRNPTTGQVDEWHMANGNWSNSVDLGSRGPAWQVAGIGDFDGDGTSDVLWHNPTTGQVDEWHMANGNWSNSVDLGSRGPTWQVAGVGDFNHDGSSDVLWRNTTTGQVDLWLMKNGNWSASVDLGARGLDWQVAGIGDLNHDGTSDVLWRNATTGQVDEWKMANGNWAGSVDLGSRAPAWQIAAVNDFNGDGTADVLWRNPTTGDMDGWVMQNGQWFSSISFGPLSPAYSVAGSGDFNHSGTADVLWHNQTTGQTSEWLLAPV